jgi:hypothetical protein
MADPMLIALATSTLLNFAMFLYLCVSARRVPDSAATHSRVSLNAIEHAREMLLIDIRRREQLFDIRLQRLERATRVR